MKFVRITGQMAVDSTRLPASASPPVALRRAGAGRRGRGGVTNDLLLLFAVAMAVRLVWALVLPPWQAIDETEHFAYVNHIVEQGELPHPSSASGVELPYPTYSPELQRSLDTTSFYPLVRWDTDTVGIIPLLDPAAYTAARQPIAEGAGRAGGIDRDDAGNSRATTYPPLYYLVLALPDKLLHSAPVIARLFAMRATSGIFGALSCLFAYLIAYDFLRSRQWGWCLGLCLAFMPTFAQTAASVNNDALMNLLAMALIWCSVRAVLRGIVPLSLAVITVMCGVLLLLTKPTALPVLVIAALVVGGISLMHAWRTSRFARFRFAPLAVVPVGLALFAGAWLLDRSVPPVHAFAQTVPFLRAIVSPPQTNFSFGQYLRFLNGPLGRPYAWLNYSQFWGWFGWGYAVLPPAAVVATVPVCLVGFVGAVIRAAHLPQERGVWFLCLAFVLAQTVFLLYGVEYRLSFAIFGKAIGLEGRYLFPVLLPLLLAIIAGWAHFFRDSTYALRGAMLAMFALQLVGLSAVLTRYYDVVVGWIR